MTDFDAASAVLESFRRSLPQMFEEREVHGIVVYARPEGLEIQVRVRTQDGLLRLKSLLPSRFTYIDKDGAANDIPVTVVIAPQSRAISTRSRRSNQVGLRAGDSCAGIDLLGYGTAGWLIYLNGVLVIVSNWHVLCGKGNDTPIGRPVLFGGLAIGSLYTFQPVTDGTNYWDYALASINDPTVVEGGMRPCDDGTTFDSPTELTNNPSIGGREQYRKIGDRLPTCRTGTLDGVGLINVCNDETNACHWFDKQLVFSKMTDPGDSGAMIVRVSDNTVCGLNMSGSDTETDANPFFLNNWIPSGILTTTRGQRFPMLTGSVSVLDLAVAAIPPGIRAPEMLPLSSRNPQISIFSPPPSVTAGLFFLGVARASVDFENRFIGPWITPPPAPIRNVPVQVYIGGFDPSFAHNPSAPVCLFFCFG